MCPGKLLVFLAEILALALESSSAIAAGDDIVDTAVGAGSFSTVVAAVKAAGLTGTLKIAGPITVFAPIDEPFAMLPKVTFDALLADIEEWKQVLLRAGVPGKVMAEDG